MTVDVTEALHRWQRGDAQSEQQVLELLYDELHRSARGQLRRAPDQQTLGATDLLHEAYLKLAGARAAQPWQSRQHFVATAVTAMRHILINRAARRHAAKRGGGAAMVTLDDEVAVAVEDSPAMLLALDEALSALEALHPRLAKVVECRYFAGMTEAQIADELGMNERTVRRDWQKAKVFLATAVTADA